MSTQLIICLVICALTCIAMTSLAALSLTGCLAPSEALAYFSNNNVIMIGAMSVVAAGFNRTKFCTDMATTISRLAKGSLSKILLMYCILAMLLSQMVQSPVVVFGIVAPLCVASAESIGVSKTRIALPLGIVAIATCCTLPIGTGATQAAELNGYIISYYDKIANFTGTMPEVGFFDPMKARLPMLIFSVLYCAFIMPKFCPETPSVVTEESSQKKAAAREELSVFAEIAGIVIFFGVAIALMLQANVLKMLQIWQICMIGAVLMIICGVLKPREALQAIPVSMLLLIVGALAMAGALSATGTGDFIGGGIAKIVTVVNNNYIVGLIFFVVPFILTQFMSNRGAMLIFIPIAIATCYQNGGDPRGLIILIQAGALTAFMTPMATGAVPYMMEYGGYDQKDLLKSGWLFAVLGCIISVGWIMTIMPVL